MVYSGVSITRRDFPTIEIEDMITFKVFYLRIQ